MNAARVLVFGSKVAPHLWLVSSGVASTTMAAKRRKTESEPVHPIQAVLEWLQPIAQARGDVESDIASKLGIELLSIAWRGPSETEAKWLRQMWATRTKIHLTDKPKDVRYASIRRQIEASLNLYAATKLTPERASKYVVADLSAWFKHDSDLRESCKLEETATAIARAIECLRNPRGGFTDSIEAVWKCFGVWVPWKQHKQGQRVKRSRAKNRQR